jgi:methionyl aminopeptidase
MMKKELFRGYVSDDVDCSHYMKIFDARPTPIRNGRAKAMLKAIEENFGTLAFCRRWLNEIGFDK